MREILACMAMLLCGFTSNAQEPTQRTQEFVSVPREIVMPLVAVQPDCPLQFERVERLMNVDGGGPNLYRLLNRGSKPITGFTIAYLYPNGNGGSSGWPRAGKRLVGPGEYVDDTIEAQTKRLRPLNDALKDKLDLRGPMKGFVIYFVESVEFADGSSYKDETTYNALRLYLEDLGEKVYQAERKSPASP
jgi:hypothetical protein